MSKNWSFIKIIGRGLIFTYEFEVCYRGWTCTAKIDALLPFCIAVYMLEKQHVHISKDTYVIPYHTYLLAELLCTSTMVHTWLAESKRVLLKRQTSE